jgi:hypothetical protein
MARELGLSEGAVRQLLHRARATLREAIAALIPFSPVVRFVRRRSEGLPVPEAAPLAGGSAGAVVVAACKVGAILVATGGLAAIPVVHTLRSRAVPVSKSVEPVAGLHPALDKAPARPGIESQPIVDQHGTGGRTTSSATPAGVAAADATDPSAIDPGADGEADPNAGDARGDNSAAPGDSPDPSSDVAADESPGPGADAAADPAQTSDVVDPAADTTAPGDPAPDPSLDPAPADAAPADPLLTP